MDTNSELPKTEEEVKIGQIGEESEETEQQINWRRFREQQKEERKALAQEKKMRAEAETKAQEERARAEAIAKALESVVDKRSSDDSSSLEDSSDERVKAAVSKAIQERFAQEDADRRKRDLTEMPDRLRKTFPDFSIVCSEENVDWLKFNFPEVERALGAQPDGFDKWADVYHTIKKLVPNNRGKEASNKIEKNLSRPQSMSVSGITQTGDSAPQQLDDKRRSDNWARMQRAMRNI